MLLDSWWFSLPAKSIVSNSGSLSSAAKCQTHPGSDQQGWLENQHEVHGHLLVLLPRVPGCSRKICWDANASNMHKTHEMHGFPEALQTKRSNVFLTTFVPLCSPLFPASSSSGLSDPLQGLVFTSHSSIQTCRNLQDHKWPLLSVAEMLRLGWAMWAVCRLPAERFSTLLSRQHA